MKRSEIHLVTSFDLTDCMKVEKCMHSSRNWYFIYMGTVIATYIVKFIFKTIRM